MVKQKNLVTGNISCDKTQEQRSKRAREQSRLLDLYKRAALVAASKRDAKLCYSAGTSPGSLPWLRKIWGTPRSHE